MELKLCHYCKEPLSKTDITKDHVIPVSKLKKINNKEEILKSLELKTNKVYSCYACNQNKSNLDYKSFISLGITKIKHLKKVFLDKQFTIKNKKKKYKRKKKGKWY